MKKLTNVISAAVAAAVFVAAPLVAGVRPVSADTTFNMSLPINTIVRGDYGSVHELKSENVDQKYQGMVCSVNATAENQHSVHPGNDLIVASNGGSVVLEDVERAGGVITNANGNITLSDKVTVSLKLGKDKVFSGGMDVNIKCVEPEIEVCRDHKVVTIKKSERRESDTDLPCPAPKFDANIVCTVEDNKAVFTLNIDQSTDHTNVSYNPAAGTVLDNGEAVEVTATYNDGSGDKTVTVTAPRVADCTPNKIEVCRDGKVISIFESDRKDTDTDAPCPVPEIKVCRDGEVITIKEDQKKDTDTAADSTCVKGTTTELPNTGAGSIAGLLGATFAGGTAIAQLRMRRNANR